MADAITAKHRVEAAADLWAQFVEQAIPILMHGASEKDKAITYVGLISAMTGTMLADIGVHHSDTALASALLVVRQHGQEMIDTHPTRSLQ